MEDYWLPGGEPKDVATWVQDNLAWFDARKIPGDEAARDPGDVEKTWYHPQRWIRNWPQYIDQLHFPENGMPRP